MRKHREIKLVTTKRRRNHLVSVQNHYTTKLFTESLLAIEMKKTLIAINEPVYLGLSILELSNILMYDFWNDYVKPKLFYIDTDIKTDYIYKDIAENVETRFDSSNYESDRLFPKDKILKSNWINER